MFRISLADVKVSFLVLLHSGSYLKASEVIERSLKHLQTPDEYASILDLLLLIPRVSLLELHSCRCVLARVLALNQRETDLLRLLEQCKPLCSAEDFAGLQLELACSLELGSQAMRVRGLLEEIIGLLEGESLGRALVWYGWVLFELKVVDWQVFFERGFLLLDGLWLARGLINYGYCLSESGFADQAKLVWLRALPLVKNRVRTKAHLLYNLGVLSQKFFLPEAEIYFLELERVSRNPGAVSMRAGAWLGVALSRRVRGEWSRAEAAYESALSEAEDAFDKSNAYRGLARVYLLSGRALKALEILEFALAEPLLEPDALLLGKAQVLLKMGLLEETALILQRVSGTKDSLRWGVAVLQAELARLAGQVDVAKTILLGLPLDSLLAREEALRFPELMALLPVPPVPLLYNPDLVVQVEARGTLVVRVNGVQIPIPPCGKVAELLVFLLENNGKSSLEPICDALYRHVDLKRAKRRLWMVVRALRVSLGWEGSVQAGFGAYLLDPNTVWQYDIRAALSKAQSFPNFLSGVYSPWVLERQRVTA